MVKALKSTNADLVHAQWTYEFAHAALASGLPFLATARDAPWTIAFQTRAPYRIFRAAYSSWLIKKIRRLSVISPYLMERFTSMGYSKKMDLVPNGLPHELFLQEDLMKRRLNALSDLKPNHPVRFLSVTGWDRRKNPKTLIRAFALLRKSYRQIKLNLVGKGMGTGGPAETWARKNGFLEGITFSGSVDYLKVLQLMRTGSDVFVHSTREESFCMTILEALAQGMPAVALPGSGAVPWLLDGGKAGKLATSGNWTDLAIAMEEMILDLDQRHRYALAGYWRAKHHFKMEDIAKLYINLYQDIISSKKPPV
jgi:glycosyltransferase involved in cell wall biosynthesis